MSVAPGLRRLLRIRGLEEEQLCQALAGNLAELRRAENALVGLLDKMRQERRSAVNLLTAENHLGFTVALAGLHYMKERASALEAWIALLKDRAEGSRGLLLIKRTERKQAETLIQRIAQDDATAATRQSQQAVDSWYLGRVSRAAESGGGNQA